MSHCVNFAALSRLSFVGLVLCWLAFFAGADALAQQKKKTRKPTAFWPEEVAFDSAVPTPREHFGFEVGFRHLDHAQIVSYLKAVAASSDRVELAEYGKTHGGRSLLLLTITSPENHGRIKSIQRDSRRLTKEDSSRVDTSALPAVINMGYGVHGDESSATNCSPLVVHYLAAAKGDKIAHLLKNVVVLLDPSLNPDGFNRFANWANRYRGRNPNPDPQHAEHNQQWPPGRVNYYWFDLNRDWLPLVHPESQGRMKWYHQWKPNVVLDFHEMGTNSTYFFQPGIPERTNPLTPEKNVELTQRFAKYHAAALDNRGSLYYTQESFDDFYMGKGSTYPDLHGAVGILFEQASARGHVQKNQDGLLHFHDTIANQFTTSLSSLQATVDLREELHQFKREFYKESLSQAAKAPKQTYLFSCPQNRHRLQQFASVLRRHDIQCYWLKEPFDYGDETFAPEFTLVVPVAQPEFRFFKSLLMRRTNFRENIFYDVSSWTLSMAYGLNQQVIRKSIPVEKLQLAKLGRLKSSARNKWAESDIAYLVDWRNDGAQRVLAQLLKQDVKVRVARKEFGVNSGDETIEFPRGTLQIPLGVQRMKTKAIRNILNTGISNGVSVTGVSSGLSATGIDLGSSNFPVVQEPQIAMLTGTPVSAYGAGEIWHMLDTRVGLPLTMLKTPRLQRADLDDYSVVVFPSGRYGELGERMWEKLKEYVSSGGTIVAVGGSAGLVAEKITGSEEVQFSAKEESNEKDDSIQKPFASAATDQALKLISGAIFNTKVDLTHPLAFGMTRSKLPVFRNHSSFLKPSKSPYANPFIYDTEQPLLAGYCSDENVERFKGSASVVVYPSGRGRVILISDNPNFRGFWYGTARIFTNAIFFGNMTSR